MALADACLAPGHPRRGGLSRSDLRAGARAAAGDARLGARGVRQRARELAAAPTAAIEIFVRFFDAEGEFVSDERAARLPLTAGLPASAGGV